MTNSPCIGRALSLRCKSFHRHIELTGGGRTKRSEVYPDELCKAILKGLVEQMSEDERIGGSFKSCDHVFDVNGFDESFEVNEVCEGGRICCPDLPVLTWSRKDYGTTRLMMPGDQGPLWSSCINRVTVDLDTNQVVEDRSTELIKGRERRREFKGGPKKTS